MTNNTLTAFLQFINKLFGFLLTVFDLYRIHYWKNGEFDTIGVWLLAIGILLMIIWGNKMIKGKCVIPKKIFKVTFNTVIFLNEEHDEISSLDQVVKMASDQILERLQKNMNEFKVVEITEGQEIDHGILSY